MNPRETIKAQCTMEDERPRPLLQRSFSARLPNQHEQSRRQHISTDHRDCYLQFQPDGATRSFAIPANAVSFDEGIDVYASPGNIYGTEDIFHFEEHHGRPPRVPRRHLSLHPSQSLYYSTAPVHHDPMQFYGDHRPALERRNSGYLRTKHLGGDRSGAFHRESDRYRSTKQLLRRPSLSTISPEPRSFVSTKSLGKGRSKKSTKKAKGRHQYAEMEESDSGYWNRSDPKPFQPQRSNSIYRKFEKNKKLDRHVDDDVWVERLILNDNGAKKTCFKSLRGNVTRKEPPTGASTIVYLEDIIVDKEGNPSRARPVENKEQAKKKKKKRKESKKQEPELQAEENSSQSEKSTLKELENSETQSSSTETEIEAKEKGKKKKIRPKGLLKRRGSLFGFMKKKSSSTGKNKTG